MVKFLLTVFFCRFGKKKVPLFFSFWPQTNAYIKRFDLQTQISFHNSPTLHEPTKANETRNIYAFITNITKNSNNNNCGNRAKTHTHTHTLANNQLTFVHFVHLFAQIAVYFEVCKNCMLIFSTPLNHPGTHSEGSEEAQRTDLKHEHHRTAPIYAHTHKHKMSRDEWSRRNAAAIAVQCHNALLKFQKRKLNNSYKTNIKQNEKKEK